MAFSLPVQQLLKEFPWMLGTCCLFCFHSATHPKSSQLILGWFGDDIQWHLTKRKPDGMAHFYRILGKWCWHQPSTPTLLHHLLLLLLLLHAPWWEPHMQIPTVTLMHSLQKFKCEKLIYAVNKMTTVHVCYLCWSNLMWKEAGTSQVRAKVWTRNLSLWSLRVVSLYEWVCSGSCSFFPTVQKHAC